MTRTTNARVAGFTFLLYIAAGVASFMHVPHALGLVLSLIMCFSALVLGVTLYAITCDEDGDLARLALICRAGEGLLGAMFIPASLALRSLGTVTTNPPNAEVLRTLSAGLAKAEGWNAILCATFFAVGSTLFAYLFLRGRIVPVSLAWLGLVASVILVIGLPLQLAGILSGAVAQLMWIPVAAFELVLGPWLMVKGVRLPERTHPPSIHGGVHHDPAN